MQLNGLIRKWQMPAVFLRTAATDGKVLNFQLSAASLNFAHEEDHKALQSIALLQVRETE